MSDLLKETSSACREALEAALEIAYFECRENEWEDEFSDELPDFDVRNLTPLYAAPVASKNSGDALQEIKRLVTAPNRNHSSERLDRIERVCDRALSAAQSSSEAVAKPPKCECKKPDNVRCYNPDCPRPA